MTDTGAERADEALLADFVAGDRAAFDALADRYQTRVYGICLRYFRDPADAEDAAQEAFVALYRRASTFQGASKFSTWMYRVATNACNDLARKRARRPQTVPLPDADRHEGGGLPAAPDVLADRELGEDLRSALALLEPEQREAVVLHDVLGFPYAEIAQRYGVAVGTIKSRIHRGHSRLAQHLGSVGQTMATEPSGDSRPPTNTP